eukprot:1185336-Prorocentrum_minimum.AAC.2
MKGRKAPQCHTTDGRQYRLVDFPYFQLKNDVLPSTPVRSRVWTPHKKLLPAIVATLPHRAAGHPREPPPCRAPPESASWNPTPQSNETCVRCMIWAMTDPCLYAPRKYVDLLCSNFPELPRNPGRVCRVTTLVTTLTLDSRSYDRNPDRNDLLVSLFRTAYRTFRVYYKN